MKGGAERLCCAPEFWLRAESGVRAEPGAKPSGVPGRERLMRLTAGGFSALFAAHLLAALKFELMPCEEMIE